jgi:hypothetical protein
LTRTSYEKEIVVLSTCHAIPITGLSKGCSGPFGLSCTPAAPHLLYLRNKLSSPGFANASQLVTHYGSPAAAAAAPGPYYPRAAVCPPLTLTTKGPQACLAHP